MSRNKFSIMTHNQIDYDSTFQTTTNENICTFQNNKIGKYIDLIPKNNFFL